MDKREARKEIKAAKMGYEKRLSENIKTNSKAFWKYVQSKTKTRESVDNLIDDRGEIVTECIKKATILNEFFTVSLLKKTPQKCHCRCEGVSIDNFEITAEMVEKYLKRLNASKSQGPDNLHPNCS